MTTQDRIERLREHCEYVLLHANADGWTVADLLHTHIGLTVRYHKSGEVEYGGSSIDVALDKAWEGRP